MKKAFIIGAGPAGLTAAYELLKQSDEYEVTVFEESFHMGGISKTVNYKGNRMDMGGHRFFSKVPEVNAWWEQMLPMQGAPAADDIMLQRDVPLEKGGPDPQKEDRVMLNRNRVSRIYFDQKFYDYPIQLKPELFMNMGFLQTMQVGFSYLASLIHKRPENSLEDFYINRFGKKLYSMFFEHYTENLWGRHPRDIDPSWGAQRVKGLSIIAILKDILWKIVPTKKAHQVETSLIESFRYPKLGPGELWDVTASEIDSILSVGVSYDDFIDLIARYGNDENMQGDVFLRWGYLIHNTLFEDYEKPLLIGAYYAHGIEQLPPELSNKNTSSQYFETTDGKRIVKITAKGSIRYVVENRSLAKGPMPYVEGDEVWNLSYDGALAAASDIEYDDQFEVWFSEANVTYYYDRFKSNYISPAVPEQK
jgi:hypothetical protein